MLTYLMRRIAYGVLILFGVNLLTFVLFFADDRSVSQNRRSVLKNNCSFTALFHFITLKHSGNPEYNAVNG